MSVKIDSEDDMRKRSLIHTESGTVRCVAVRRAGLKAAFHDTDTDILARTSVSVSMSMSWNAALNKHTSRECSHRVRCRAARVGIMYDTPHRTVPRRTVPRATQRTVSSVNGP